MGICTGLAEQYAHGRSGLESVRTVSRDRPAGVVFQSVSRSSRKEFLVSTRTSPNRPLVLAVYVALFLAVPVLAAYR